MPWFKLRYRFCEAKAIGQFDQGADGIEGDFAVWIHVAEVAYFHESGRQHVLEEAPDELHSVESHGSPAVAMRFTVPEGNAVILGFDDTVVGDCDFEDIGGEVFDGGEAVAYGLAVNVPLDIPDFGRDEIEEAGFFHLIVELGSEDFGQSFDGQVEVDT